MNTPYWSSVPASLPIILFLVISAVVVGLWVFARCVGERRAIPTIIGGVYVVLAMLSLGIYGGILSGERDASLSNWAHDAYGITLTPDAAHTLLGDRGDRTCVVEYDGKLITIKLISNGSHPHASSLVNIKTSVPLQGK